MRKILYLILCIFIFPIAFSYPLEISYRVIDKDINLTKIGDYAEYIITIKNLGNEKISIIPDISPTDKWIGLFNPSILELNPKEEKNIRLVVYATGYDKFPKIVSVYFFIKGEKEEVFLPISVFGKRERKEPNVDFEIRIPQKVYINRKFEIEVFFKNKDKDPYYSVITFYSDALRDIYRYTEIIYPGNSSKRYTFLSSKKLGCFPIDIILNVKNKILRKVKRICVELSPSSLEIRETKEGIEIKNLEDIDIKYRYSLEVSSIDELFYEFYPKQDYVYERDGKKYYVWDISLKANEKIVIKKSFKFSSILVLASPLIIFVIAYLLYITFGKRVSISKYVVSIDNKNRIIRVGLYINNKSKIPISNITVKDTIPSPFELLEEYEFEKPTIVNRSPEKTEVIWKLDKMLPGEVRVLTYDIKYGKGMIGTIELPAAKVIVNGKTIATSYSVYLKFK